MLILAIHHYFEDLLQIRLETSDKWLFVKGKLHKWAKLEETPSSERGVPTHQKNDH